AGQVRDGARLVRVVTAAATALAAGACLGIGQLIRAHSSARKAPTHSPSRKASR
ncbi:cobalamin biosynthesis protein, partial [Propionibacterium freudenreichii]|nr:cobalamin biosynthesis protein [Propionibacterium freudenreichii]